MHQKYFSKKGVVLYMIVLMFIAMIIGMVMTVPFWILPFLISCQIIRDLFNDLRDIMR